MPVTQKRCRGGGGRTRKRRARKQKQKSNQAMWNVYERLMAEAEKLKEPPRPIAINELVRTPSRSSNSLETVRLENMEEPALHHRTPVRVIRELRSRYTMNNKVHNRRRHQGPKETLLNTEESL